MTVPICSRAPARCHCQSLSPHSLRGLTWAVLKSTWALSSLGAVPVISAAFIGSCPRPAAARAALLEETNRALGLEAPQHFLG